MERLSFINYVISLLFFFVILISFCIFLKRFFSSENENKSVEKNYAVLISARNEEKNRRIN